MSDTAHDSKFAQAEVEPNPGDISHSASNVTNALLLGVVAAEGFVGERVGAFHGLRGPVKAAANSISHPFIGYSVGWAAAVAANRRNITRPLKSVNAFVAVTTANFMVETGQSLILDNPGHKFSFLTAPERIETIKDYAFALGGLALFTWENRKNRRLSDNASFKPHI